MILTLASPTIVEITPGNSQVTEESSTIDVLGVSDNQTNKVIALVMVVLPSGKRIRKTLTLWEGEAYTAIGDWTQAQAEQRIKEVI